MALSCSSQATYAQTPVWEIFVRNNPIIRRQDDSWVNATQLLRAGGIERPSRTGIMDKFIKSESDYRRVQGGFGKFQGTWVPLHIAIGMANEVRVMDDLQPLLQADPGSVAVVRTTSPRPASASHRSSALSHASATEHSSRRARARQSAAAAAAAAAASVRSPQPGQLFGTSTPMSAAFPGYLPPTMSTPLSRGPASRLSVPGVGVAPISPPGLSPAPSLPPSYVTSYAVPGALPVGPEMAYRSSPALPPARAPPAPPADYPDWAIQPGVLDTETEGAALLKAIVTAGEAHEKGPVTLPAMRDIHAPLDVERNAALHYAAAYGLAQVVRDLVAQGARPSQRNADGQTALMMTCMAPHASEMDTFPQLFLELAKCVLPQTRFALAWAHDAHGDTILHHITRLAADWPTAAGAYMRPLLAALKQDALASSSSLPATLTATAATAAGAPPPGPNHLITELLDYQNARAHTALHIAVHNRCWDIATSLLDAGADPSLPDLYGTVPAASLPPRPGQAVSPSAPAPAPVPTAAAAEPVAG